jgi:hypothetical protein
MTLCRCLQADCYDCLHEYGKDALKPATPPQPSEGRRCYVCGEKEPNASLFGDGRCSDLSACEQRKHEAYVAGLEADLAALRSELAKVREERDAFRGACAKLGAEIQEKVEELIELRALSRTGGK